MESFELQLDLKTYKIIKSANNNNAFSVFNHSSFHTIIKAGNNCWEVIEHRFGDHQLPLQQIGAGIDEYLGL